MKSFVFFLMVLFLGTSVAASNPFPIGINFGPNYITAAHYDESTGSPTPLTRIAGSPEYREFMIDTRINDGKRIPFQGKWFIRDQVESPILAPPENYNGDAVSEILSEAVASITKAARKVLNQPVAIGAVSFPDHFNRSCYETLLELPMKIYPSLFRPWQIMKSINAARYAYGLDSCEGFGFGDVECNVDDTPHLIVSAEYNREFLRLTVADAKEGSFKIDSHVMLDQQEMSQEGRQFGKLLHAFRDFIDANFKEQNETGGIANDFTNVRGIVIYGEASQPAMDVLLGVVNRVLPEELRSRVFHSIEPRYVAAAGAAYRAKKNGWDPEVGDRRILNSHSFERLEL